MIGNFTKGHWHHKKYEPLKNGTRRWKGGSSMTVYNPTPPPQPSTADAINAWVSSMPQVYQTQMQYDPLVAAQQVAMYQQFALPMAQADKAANETLYPKTAALQETMAGQATQGMSATEMPSWMRKQYLSDLNSQMGTNAGSPIAADYVSRGMQNQLFQQQKYYRDLGLSLAGRQPLSQPTAPQTPNYMGNYTPTANMNYMSGNYSAFANASRPISGQKTKDSYLWGLF